MRGVIRDPIVVDASPDQSRKDGAELRSCHFAVWIEACHIYSYEFELTGYPDVESHFSALICDVVESALLDSVWSKSTERDGEITDHLSHMRSNKRSSHIRFLDGVHSCDAMCVCPKICVVEFRRIW